MMRCLFRERVSAQRAGSRPLPLRPALQPWGNLDQAPNRGHHKVMSVRMGMGSQTLRASSQSRRCWKQEVLEAGGLVLWGCKGWPGSSADDKGDALELADETVAAILR